MGELQKRIYADIQDTSIDPEIRDGLKVLKSDIQREKDKDVSDARVEKIIISTVNGIQEMLGYLDRDDDKESFSLAMKTHEFLCGYLPKKATDDEIKEWIQENIDLSQYKNKMQAMRPIMSHFGNRADGNKVKDILMNEV